MAILAVGTGGLHAQTAQQKTEHVPGDVDATSSVILDRLSVKVLGVDRPWNPHICLGCENGNAVAANRTGRHRSR